MDHAAQCAMRCALCSMSGAHLRCVPVLRVLGSDVLRASLNQGRCATATATVSSFSELTRHWIAVRMLLRTLNLAPEAGPRLGLGRAQALEPKLGTPFWGIAHCA